jgi:hypothetical protein
MDKIKLKRKVEVTKPTGGTSTEISMTAINDPALYHVCKYTTYVPGMKPNFHSSNTFN